jgi:hypothetical protein
MISKGVKLLSFPYKVYLMQNAPRLKMQTFVFIHNQTLLPARLATHSTAASSLDYFKPLTETK